MTKSMFQFLKLKPTEIDISVSGMDDLCTNIKYTTCATIMSRFNKFHNTLILIVPQISKAIPQNDSFRCDMTYDIFLRIYRLSTLHVFIGVGLFYKLPSVDQIQLKNHSNAILQKMQLDGSLLED